MPHFLSCDVYGAFKKILYGSKGEMVKIISERGDIAVVEGYTGNKFPVSVSELTAVAPKITPTIPTPTETIIPTLKQTKTKKEGQASLF